MPAAMVAWPARNKIIPATIPARPGKAGPLIQNLSARSCSSVEFAPVPKQKTLAVRVAIAVIIIPAMGSTNFMVMDPGARMPDPVADSGTLPLVS